MPTSPRRRLLWIAGMIAGGLCVGTAAYFGIRALAETEQPAGPAPKVVVRSEEEPEAAPDIGFPDFATRNTTRVGGQDSIAAAAGAALAAFPSTGGVEGPAAVSLVDVGDWPGGIAAAVLTAAPVGAPVLLSERTEVPELTSGALGELDPQGSPETGDSQVFRIGDVAAPDGLTTTDVGGANPATTAARIAALRRKLVGDDPEHVLLASSDDAAYAMPAAAWAARSGDPVLFVQRESAPGPTLRALRHYEGVPVYVLGPTSVISDRTLEQVRDVAKGATRISGENPVANAITFARFADGSFGWNINDPGHGFVIASVDRPLDAATAAPLSASGTWGPLLVTDEPTDVPSDLRGYLLDLKPGYEGDPTRALYNHVWLIGDSETISVAFQAQVDELAEVAEVSRGTGSTVLGPAPGTPEPETPAEGSAQSGNGGGGR